MSINELKRCIAGRKVLVTGATGFIGSHLVERLVNLDADVVAADSSLGWRPIVANLVQQDRIRFFELRAFWDSNEVERLLSDLLGLEFVVHLAYKLPRGRSQFEKTYDEIHNNVLGTLKFLQLLPSTVSKFCFASSVMVYGINPPYPVSESDPVCPVTPYALSKLAVENYLMFYAKKIGISMPILRYATVFGPFETAPRAIPNFIRNVLAGKPPVIAGSGDDVRDYVHVSDVVNATILALTNDCSEAQVFNIGTGKGYSTCEIAESIIHLAGKHIKPIFRHSNQGTSRIVCNISRAGNTIGYKPEVEIYTGLKDEIKYFSDNPKYWRVL